MKKNGKWAQNSTNNASRNVFSMFDNQKALVTYFCEILHLKSLLCAVIVWYILLYNAMILIYFCMRHLFVCWPVCADVVAMPPRARKWWRVRCRCNIPAVRGFPAVVTSSRGRSHAPLIRPPSPYYHCDVDWASSIFSPVGKHKWGIALTWPSSSNKSFSSKLLKWQEPSNIIKIYPLARNTLLKFYI